MPFPAWLPRRLRPAPNAPRECRCGHEPRAHEHYRAGSDCALCDCARYRASDRPVTERPEPDGDAHDRTGSPRERIRLVA